MPADPKLVRDLFLAVAELPQADRAAYLQGQCQGNVELRAAVERLLEAHEQPASLLNQPAPGIPTADFPAISERPGTLIGPYRLMEKIGEGGFGLVFVAEQTEPVKRKVALKVIKPGMDSRQVIARFEAERQALAMMDHPNIARVLDAGTTETGRPYFVMELVRGIPITDYCDQNHLTPTERLELFVSVCHAIQHAHQKGIIHRDIKPSNVLVTSHDGKPVAKVIDFGVAKAIHQHLTERTIYTNFAQMIGTPLYMSPEQAEMSGLDIDTRSDVYSLGVLLYELLTGSTPLERKRLAQAAYDEIRRVIREEEPPRPSDRLSTSEALPSLAASRKTEPARLSRMFKGELDWIVMKALEKDRTRRYETANGLAKDIQRYLSDEVVEARPASAGYRLRKLVARNKGKAAATGLVLFVLLIGIAGTTWGLIRAQRAAEAERVAKVEAEEKKKLAQANEQKAASAAEQARQANDRESAQRIRAESAYARAADVLDTMVSSVTGNSLATQKEISAEQKKFLAEVLTYYQEFAAVNADDRKTRERTALAAFRVGLIEARLGREQQAVAGFTRARDEYAALANQFPTVPKYLENLANSRCNLGLHFSKLGQRQQAEEQYRQALVIMEKLVAGAPTVPAYRKSFAMLHNNLSVLYANSGQLNEATYQLRMVLVIQEKLVSDYPVEPEYRADLARSYRNMGVHLKELGQDKEAEVQIGKGLALQEILQTKFPAVPEYRADVARSRSLLADLLSKRGKKKDAEVQLRKCLVIWQLLAAEFPGISEYRAELAKVHNSFGILLGDLSQQTAAEEQFKKSLAIQEKLADDYPAVTEYGVNLAGYYCNIGILARDLGRPADSLVWFQKAINRLRPLHLDDQKGVLARKYLLNSYWGQAIALDRLGRADEASTEWDRAFELVPKTQLPQYQVFRARAKMDSGLIAEATAELEKLHQQSGWKSGELYNMASMYALASGKLPDKKPDYAERAMQLLQQAVKAGFKDAVQMKQDSDLDPLRDRDDFKKLLSELEPKVPQTSKAK